MTSEVVHAQEEPDPAGVLLPDYSGLALAIGSGKEEARLRPWWTNNNPSLRTPLGRDGRRVWRLLYGHGVPAPDAVVMAPRAPVVSARRRSAVADYRLRTAPRNPAWPPWRCRTTR